MNLDTRSKSEISFMGLVFPGETSTASLAGWPLPPMTLSCYCHHHSCYTCRQTFLFFFWLCPEACRILLPQPGIEPALPSLEAWGLNHWTARKVPCHPLILGVLKLWDLMPNDLRWSWCNNNRNKVHNKCHALESSRNHSLAPTPGLWKNCLPWNLSLVPNRFGTTMLYRILWLHWGPPPRQSRIVISPFWDP